MSLKFNLERVDGPLGAIFLATDDAGRLRVLDFSDYEDRMLRLLRLHYGAGAVLAESPGPSKAGQAVRAYLDGDLAAIDTVEVETGGTAFQREVWAALRTIPAGRTTSYGALAAQIGRPKAVRAVGLANGANPIAIIVPCHRVIGATGSLTGYGGGLHRKQWLLAHEGALLA